MQAPWPVTDDGKFVLPKLWCPLCHRTPVDGRIAHCGHTYCYWCLRDIQVTAALYAVIPRCKICNGNISDRGPFSGPLMNRQTPLPASSISAAVEETHEEVTENLWATNPNPIPRPSATVTSQPREQSDTDYGPQTNKSKVTTGYVSDPNNSHSSMSLTSSIRASQQRFQTPTLVLDHTVQQYHTHHTPDMLSSPAAASSTSPPPVTPLETSDTTGTTGTSIQCLGDMYFHIAGKFPSFSRRRAEILIRKHGGKVQDRINNRTDYIVLGKKASEMTQSQIKERKVTTLNVQELLNLIQERSTTISVREESMTSSETRVVTTTPEIDPRLANEEANLKEELNRVRQHESEIKRRLRDLKNLSRK